ncbi:terpenoid synthase [Favolaschia claudopus]|uniref:Terpenoid synthase n=1 Tax=Favolaschia claudopus TaxID=2862362 RepID=A0AAV9ZV65_9AGAR
MANEEFTQCIRRFLKDIGFCHEPMPKYDPQYWGPFHHWMLQVLGPKSSWNDKQLAELEHEAGGIIERVYPCASMEHNLVYAKLTAIAILIDDSIEDETVNQDITRFSERLYRGEAQKNALLALYHENMKELSDTHGQDSVLRGLAIVPWMTHIDACLMERELLLVEVATNEPMLTKYIKAVPDVTFVIELTNDVLSFHKEELAGETYNLIHLRTRSIASSRKMPGNGPDGIWTSYDTLRLMCTELRDAIRRVDGLLRLEECERKMRGESGLDDIDEIDVALAMQWRGWRHGFISWHLECRRYKLDFLREIIEAEQKGEKS